MRVQGAGCRVKGSGFKVHASGFRVQGLGFRVQGLGCRVQSFRFRVQGSGFKVQGSGFRVQGSGFRAQTSGGRTSTGAVLRRRNTHRSHGHPSGTRGCVGFADKVSGSRFRVLFFCFWETCRFRVKVARCRVQGSGFRVQILGEGTPTGVMAGRWVPLDLQEDWLAAQRGVVRGVNGCRACEGGTWRDKK